MNTLLKKLQPATLLALLVAGMLIGSAVVYAQNEDGRGEAEAGIKITFPIAELGDCTDKTSCKAYCDVGDHMEECVAFATAHGLMNKEEAAKATKFAGAIKRGAGPGGCTDPGSCKAYCEDVSHLEACVAFAEKQGFGGREYEQGKKLHAYMKSGGKMPGNCTGRVSCEAYCNDFSHAEECFAFAQKSGMADEMSREGARGDFDGEKGGPKHMPTPEQFKKLAELAKKGETPGGCTSKDSCEAYCRAEGHFDECMAFGEKIGFIKKEEAEKMKKMMEKGGPGGCKSPESCHAYCNEEANREACFTFAQENGLIPPEEIEHMKEGMVRMRQGIENAPEEVVACLKSTLGTNIIEDIQSGKLIPGPGIGERMRGCFEKFGGAHDPKEIFNDAPPEVSACLKEKLGDDFTKMKAGELKPTPEMADSFRVCFQQMEMERGGMGNHGGSPQDAQKFQGFLRSAPPEVSACLKEQLGDEYQKISTGEVVPSPELGQIMRGCFEQFRPQMMHQGDGGPAQAEQKSAAGMMQMPPEVALCLREKFGEEGFAKLGSTPKTPEVEMSMRACFEKFGGPASSGSMGGREGQSGMMQQPPQGMPQPGMGMSSSVEACLREKLGVEGYAQFIRGNITPELKTAITACFQQFGRPTTMPSPDQQEFAPPGMMAPMQPSGGEMGAPWTSRLPFGIQTCLKTKLGAELFEKIGFAPPTAEAEMAIKTCYTEAGALNTMPPPTDGGMMMPPTGEPLPPPESMLQPDGTHARKSFGNLLVGAVAAPFINLWGLIK